MSDIIARLLAMNSQALAEGATGAATDAASAAVIQEARAALAREQERYFVDEMDILKTFGLDTLDEFDAVLRSLAPFHFPPYQRVVVRGGMFSEDRASIRFEGHEWDRWFAGFDALAVRLGYRQPPTKR